MLTLSGRTGSGSARGGPESRPSCSEDSHPLEWWLGCLPLFSGCTGQGRDQKAEACRQNLPVCVHPRLPTPDREGETSEPHKVCQRAACPSPSLPLGWHGAACANASSPPAPAVAGKRPRGRSLLSGGPGDIDDKAGDNHDGST